MGGLLKRLLPAVAGDSREAEGTGSNPQRVVVLPPIFSHSLKEFAEKGGGTGEENNGWGRASGQQAGRLVPPKIFFTSQGGTKQSERTETGSGRSERSGEPSPALPRFYFAMQVHCIYIIFCQNIKNRLHKICCLFLSVILFIIFYKEF